MAFSVSSTRGAVNAAVHIAANSGVPIRATTRPQPWLPMPASVVAATAPHTTAPNTSESGSRSYRSRK